MKKIGLILLSISLFALGIFVINGFVPDATLENNSFEKLNIEHTPSPVITPGEIQNFSVAEPVELNFSGKILTCTNFTDVEQVIDIRLTNLEAKNKSISIYPINITLDLLSEQILRKDLFISPGTLILKLVSSDGEESLVQVPPCGSRVSSASDGTPTGTSTGTSTGTPTGTPAGTSTGTSTGTPAGTSTGTPAGTSTGTPAGTSTGTPIATQTITPANSKVEEIPEFPTIALPIMTIIALLFIMKKKK